jgi:hypothetical protein
MTPAEKLAESRLQRLFNRLPDWLGRLIHRVREPSARWVRIPVALLCLLGGMMFFLPVLGIWMLPLGLLLLVEDLPFLRRGVYGSVNWLAQRRPHWFT